MTDTETSRYFTVACDGKFTTFEVNQLTVRLLRTRISKLTELVIGTRTKSYEKVAALLQGKERMQYLLEVGPLLSKSVTDDELDECANSAEGIIATLALACPTLSEARIKELWSECDSTEELDYARYYCLGVDIDKLKALVNTPATETKEEAATPQPQFQV